MKIRYWKKEALSLFPRSFSCREGAGWLERPGSGGESRMGQSPVRAATGQPLGWQLVLKASGTPHSLLEPHWSSQLPLVCCLFMMSSCLHWTQSQEHFWSRGEIRDMVIKTTERRCFTPMELKGSSRGRRRRWRRSREGRKERKKNFSAVVWNKNMQADSIFHWRWHWKTRQYALSVTQIYLLTSNSTWGICYKEII